MEHVGIDPGGKESPRMDRQPVERDLSRWSDESALASCARAASSYWRTVAKSVVTMGENGPGCPLRPTARALNRAASPPHRAANPAITGSIRLRSGDAYRFPFTQDSAMRKP